MKINRNNLKKLSLTGFLIISLLFCCLIGCGKKHKEPETSAPATTEEQTETETETELLPEMKIVTDAIQSTVLQNRYSLQTNAMIHLNGKLINGDYNLVSQVEILRNGENGLEMTTVSSSDMDDIVTKSYYKDGVYHVAEGSEITETEKTEDEVMAGVSQVTDLIIQAAATVGDVEVSETDKGTAYSYRISSMLAKSYLKSLIDGLKIDKLSGATINPEEVSFVTVIDSSGNLAEQGMTLSGNIQKAIFSVPAAVEVTADFTILEENTLDYKDFDY